MGAGCWAVQRAPLLVLIVYGARRLADHAVGDPRDGAVTPDKRLVVWPARQLAAFQRPGAHARPFLVLEVAVVAASSMRRLPGPAALGLWGGAQ